MKNRNLLAAEALGLDYNPDDVYNNKSITEYVDGTALSGTLRPKGYFDLSDSNCRDRVIEHFKIDVFHNAVWIACVDKGIDTVDFTNPSRDKAIDMCIDKLLGVEDA